MNCRERSVFDGEREREREREDWYEEADGYDEKELDINFNDNEVGLRQVKYKKKDA